MWVRRCGSLYNRPESSSHWICRVKRISQRRFLHSENNNESIFTIRCANTVISMAILVYYYYYHHLWVISLASTYSCRHKHQRSTFTDLWLVAFLYFSAYFLIFSVINLTDSTHLFQSIVYGILLSILFAASCTLTCTIHGIRRLPCFLQLPQSEAVFDVTSKATSSATALVVRIEQRQR